MSDDSILSLGFYDTPDEADRQPSGVPSHDPICDLALLRGPTRSTSAMAIASTTESHAQELAVPSCVIAAVWSCGLRDLCEDRNNSSGGRGAHS
jgi:hypothetical protein